MTQMTETVTPSGEPGLLLTCDNRGHHCYGKSAIIRKTDTMPTLGPQRACKLIEVAHSPWANAANVRRLGPWKA